MSSIPFSNIIFSGLDAKIDIGNRIIKHLEEFIDIDGENISHEEFQLSASKTSSDHTITVKEDMEDLDELAYLETNL
jgi:hypothetical protein